MFQFFQDPKIDFMGKRRLWLGISAVAVLLSLIVLPVRGIHYGIEFLGGTELQLRYVAPPDLGAIRSALSTAGLGSPSVTTIGDPKENEVYIRLGLAEAGKEQDVIPKLLDALHAVSPAGSLGDRRDLNRIDAATLRTVLESPDVTRDDAERLAQGIVDRRKELAVFRSVDDVSGIDGMSPAALTLLRDRTQVGPFAVRSQSYVGPTIGRELLQKALWAIVGSLVGMLVYIGFRFQFRWGVAAVVALVHDTIVTLGLFALFGKEMSLSVVAAFLTLIGYSVNDTVVVFDRIRETIKMRGAGDLAAVVNLSINQTLSRTTITSGLTLMVVLALLFFAGEPLNPFAFVLAVGIVVGTYSSIFIASPILVMWQQFLDGRKGAKGTVAAAAPPAPGAKKAKKVPASPAR